MLPAVTVAAAVVGALFAPTPSCDAPPYEAVKDLNRMFVAATHKIPVRCHAGNTSVVTFGSDGLDLRCGAGDDCFAVLTSYIAGSPHLDPVEAISAVGAAIGSPVLECTNTSGCDHPRAACIPTASVPGVGFCQPNSTVTVAKEVCYAGLHCSCDELIAAAIGFAVGLGLQVTANTFTSPIGSAVEMVMQTTINDFY
tara:strand:+ start:2634 stop:3224 length:591 start_codon:yes stop_codon:yes gene_type:complete